MSIGNEYFANPQRLQSSIKMISENNARLHRIFGDFEQELSRYAGWNGTSDSFWRETEENKKKEEKSVSDTGSAMREASEAITVGVLSNAKNITHTQESNLDSIQEQGRRRRGGSH